MLHGDGKTTRTKPNQKDVIVSALVRLCGCLLDKNNKKFLYLHCLYYIKQKIKLSFL